MPSFASRLLLLHTGYRAGGLRESDTDNECWSDTEVVPQPPARPREKPLGRSQSLRVIKRKPLAREVGGEAGTREGGCPYCRAAPTIHNVPAFSPPTGHLTLPEGSDKEKDRTLRHGQLGSAEPGRVLPPALRGAGALPRDLWLYQQPSWPSWLLLTVRGRVQGRTHDVPKQTGLTVLFITFLAPLPSQMWDQSPPQTPGK